MDLSDYILEKLRKNGSLNIQLVLSNKEYNTFHGKITIEEINMIIDDIKIEDFGIEAFEQIEIKK